MSELKLLPSVKSEEPERKWWQVPSKQVLGWAICVLIGAVGSQFQRLEGMNAKQEKSRAEEIQNLKKAVSQNEQNEMTRMLQRMANAEGQLGWVKETLIANDAREERRDQLQERRAQEQARHNETVIRELVQITAAINGRGKHEE